MYPKSPTHETFPSSSGFSQTYKFVNIGIISNFIFSYICSFLLYLQHVKFVNMKLHIGDVLGSHFKVAAFTGPGPF